MWCTYEITGKLEIKPCKMIGSQYSHLDSKIPCTYAQCSGVNMATDSTYYSLQLDWNHLTSCKHTYSDQNVNMWNYLEAAYMDLIEHWTLLNMEKEGSLLFCSRLVDSSLLIRMIKQKQKCPITPFFLVQVREHKHKNTIHGNIQILLYTGNILILLSWQGLLLYVIS